MKNLRPSELQSGDQSVVTPKSAAIVHCSKNIILVIVKLPNKLRPTKIFKNCHNLKSVDNRVFKGKDPKAMDRE